MLEVNSKQCPICTAIVPVAVTGRGRSYCGPSCYAAAAKLRRETRKQIGLCYCGKRPADGRKTCLNCRRSCNKSRRPYKSVRTNKCRNCSSQRQVVSIYCERCQTARKIDGINRKKELKSRIQAAYGGCCVCCGETCSSMLTIDHVKNDGAEHRRQMGSASNYALYKFLIEHGFPKDNFRLLCFNCNIGRFINKGRCPHEDAVLALVPTPKDLEAHQNEQNEQQEVAA